MLAGIHNHLTSTRTAENMNSIYTNEMMTWDMENAKTSIQLVCPKQEHEEDKELKLQEEFHYYNYATPTRTTFTEEYLFQNSKLTNLCFQKSRVTGELRGKQTLKWARVSETEQCKYWRQIQT